MDGEKEEEAPCGDKALIHLRNSPVSMPIPMPVCNVRSSQSHAVDSRPFYQLILQDIQPSGVVCRLSADLH